MVDYGVRERGREVEEQNEKWREPHTQTWCPRHFPPASVFPTPPVVTPGVTHTPG